MVNLPSHYIEHEVDTLITSPCFFGIIFGSGGGWVPILGRLDWPPGSCLAD